MVKVVWIDKVIFNSVIGFYKEDEEQKNILLHFHVVHMVHVVVHICIYPPSPPPPGVPILSSKWSMQYKRLEFHNFTRSNFKFQYTVLPVRERERSFKRQGDEKIKNFANSSIRKRVAGPRFESGNSGNKQPWGQTGKFCKIVEAKQLKNWWILILWLTKKFRNKILKFSLYFK